MTEHIQRAEPAAMAAMGDGHTRMDEVILYRMMYDDAADAHLIATAILPEEFPSPLARRLFERLAQRALDWEPTDVVTMGNLFKGEDEDLRSLVYELSAFDPSTAMEGRIAHDIETFHQWSYRERVADLIWVSHRSIQEGMPAEEVKLELERRLDSLDLSRDDERQYDDLAAHAEEVKQFLASDLQPGVPYGIEQMDRVLAPPMLGNLVEIGGASGTGKSTVARNLWRRLAHAGRPTAYFSAEMTALEQLLGLACMDTGLDWGDALANRIPMEKRNDLWLSVKWWRDQSKIVLNDRAYLTPALLLRLMKRYLTQHGTQVFIIDHLHRIDFGETKGNDLRLHAGALTRDLKNFALTHKVVVILLVQLVKMQPWDEPNDSNVRESAKIIEEADRLLFVYRPRVWGRRDGWGLFSPIPRDLATGKGRFFEHEESPEASATLGFDEHRVYIKPGKQRVRPQDALISVPFNPSSTLMGS